MNKKKYSFLLIIILLIFVSLAVYQIFNSQKSDSLSEKQMIYQHINEKMKEGKIPGAAIAVIKDNQTIIQEGFGYADLNKKTPVEKTTLFELGSVSKSFTGYAVQLLAAQEKLDLDHSVSEYLPWFQVTYKNEAVDIRVRDLLYQTSGIPFDTIKDIPQMDSEDALYATIFNLIGTELSKQPGLEFSYATINYDVLGLIIQEVTQMPYETFMEEHIFPSFHMNGTYADRTAAYASGYMSTGYKIGFYYPRAYDAPTYRGNTPAGYMISNLSDMTSFIEHFMDGNRKDKFTDDVVERALDVNRRVLPSDNLSSYASGWYQFQLGSGEYSHGGGNPNYSSYIAVRPKDNTGVVVLTNVGGVDEFTESIGKTILDIMENREETVVKPSMVTMDNFASTIAIFVIILSLVLFFFIGRYLQQYLSKSRLFIIKPKQFLVTAFLTIIMAVLVYFYPKVFYNGLDWDFLKIWAPVSVPTAAISMLCFVFLYLLYYLLYACGRDNPGKTEKVSFEIPVFLLVSFSFISGMGNAFVIYMLNRSLEVMHPVREGMVWYFAFGVCVYALSQKIIRQKLTEITKMNIQKTRNQIIESLLKKPYRSFETIDPGEIKTVLNKDTEELSEFPMIFIELITTLVTITICLIYLSTLNRYGFVFIFAILLIVVTMYGVSIEKANRLIEETRGIQEKFFGFIDGLIYGMKELKLSTRKSSEFQKDMNDSACEYRDIGIQIDQRFIKLLIAGELIFTGVLGAVAFVVPELFKHIKKAEIATFIFVLIYLTNPIRSLLSNIPRLLSMNISRKRLKKIITNYESDIEVPIEKEETFLKKHVEKIIVKDMSFQFDSQRDFYIGPISLTLQMGELIFIVGGNGSGKTTLVKLLTNLYRPQTGTITGYLKDNTPVDLSNQVSQVFYDYFLFQKLYGVNAEESTKEAQSYLRYFKLDNKVQIEEGRFSTIDLSSGQKKRLALLQACVENNSVLIFDEVAADQDPEFKKFYYETFLKELVSQNKIVIIVTHDDHYYHLADKIIKLNNGTVESISSNSKR